MVGPEDWLLHGRKRGMRRSTTRYREDPVKAAPSGRASRISRDYVNVGLVRVQSYSVLTVSILHAYARPQDKVKIYRYTNSIVAGDIG